MLWIIFKIFRPILIFWNIFSINPKSIDTCSTNHLCICSTSWFTCITVHEFTCFTRFYWTFTCSSRLYTSTVMPIKSIFLTVILTLFALLIIITLRTIFKERNFRTISGFIEIINTLRISSIRCFI
jgi:hypothetical protein